jgi:hypothetical protein
MRSACWWVSFQRLTPVQPQRDGQGVPLARAIRIPAEPARREEKIDHRIRKAALIKNERLMLIPLST